MSSGCAPMAMAIRPGISEISSPHCGYFHLLPGCRRFVGRENYFVTAHSFLQAGERHFSARVERVEECLELRQIRVVGYVAGVEHLHRKLAPLVFVQPSELV